MLTKYPGVKQLLKHHHEEINLYFFLNSKEKIEEHKKEIENMFKIMKDA